VYRRRYESLACRSPNCIRKTRNTICGTPVSVPLLKFCEKKLLLSYGQKLFLIWRPSAILNFRGPRIVFLPRDAMYKRSLCRHTVFVCPSVTFVNPIKTSNRILRLLSPSGSQTILVFQHQTSWQYSDGDPLTGASNAGGGRHKLRFSTNSWLSIDDRCSANNCDRPLCSLPHTSPRTLDRHSLHGPTRTEEGSKLCFCPSVRPTVCPSVRPSRT